MYVILGDSDPVVFTKIMDSIIEAGFKHVVGYGKYNGTKEESVMVSVGSSLTDFEDIRDLIEIGRKNNQECVMLITDKGACSLIYPEDNGDFSTKDIGLLKQLTPYEAKQEDSYSYFNCHYFGVQDVSN